MAASEWIYEYVPPTSALAIEHWDTPLPLPMDVEGRACRSEEYDLHILTLYDEPEDAAKWSALAGHLAESDYLFPSRVRRLPHLSTRQYARIVNDWVRAIGLNPSAYGTHSLRRTKATLIYRRTKNLRAVQLLPGHSKLDSAVRYLGMEIDDALEMSEQTDV